MSEFEDISDDHSVVCPYCQHHYDPESEDFSEDHRAEECGGCGKKYHLRQQISVSHETEPDCELNGEEHVYKPVQFPDGHSRGFCSICGRIQPNESELQQCRPNT